LFGGNGIVFSKQVLKSGNAGQVALDFMAWMGYIRDMNNDEAILNELRLIRANAEERLELMRQQQCGAGRERVLGWFDFAPESRYNLGYE
jgi:hypothetical protein